MEIIIDLLLAVISLRKGRHRFWHHIGAAYRSRSITAFAHIMLRDKLAEGDARATAESRPGRPNKSQRGIERAVTMRHVLPLPDAFDAGVICRDQWMLKRCPTAVARMTPEERRGKR